MNASEAKQLSEKNDPEKILQKILDQIKSAASEGKTDIKVYDAGFGSGRMYGASYDKYDDTQKYIANELHKLGYEAYSYVEYGCQFADVFLRVSWKDA